MASVFDIFFKAFHSSLFEKKDQKERKKGRKEGRRFSPSFFLNVTLSHQPASQLTILPLQSHPKTPASGDCNAQRWPAYEGRRTTTTTTAFHNPATFVFLLKFSHNLSFPFPLWHLPFKKVPHWSTPIAEEVLVPWAFPALWAESSHQTPEHASASKLSWTEASQWLWDQQLQTSQNLTLIYNNFTEGRRGEGRKNRILKGRKKETF